MKSAVILLILSSFLLLQISHTVPIPFGTILEKVFENILDDLGIQNTTAKNIFIIDRERDMAEVLNVTINGGKDLFKKIVEKASKTENQSPEFQAHMTNFTQFIEIIDTMNQKPESAQIPDIYTNFQLFSEINNRYNAQNISGASRETKYFEQLLLEGDYQEVILSFTQGCIEVINKFGQAVGEYVSSLSPEQRERESKVINWYETQLEKQKANPDEWMKSLPAMFGYNEVQ